MGEVPLYVTFPLEWLWTNRRKALFWQLNAKRSPHGGLSGFRAPSNLGSYVNKSAPHKVLKSIARGKLAFDYRVVLHPVADGRERKRSLLTTHWSESTESSRWS